jgi:hypothetical protein
MAKYKYKIVETLERVITVEADSYDEGFSKLEDMHSNAEVVLDAEDFTGYEIYPAESE